ncbi:tRNA pseudouridine(55) synthase TruB [Laceyella putida]|uniref:tRNA pseudouridine synthase B n=1 Tax=Laceyella putida TaxID=110101 RepID=A0ABW2RP34_9BACL
MTLHGIMPVFKPKGRTSHDMVALIRRLAKQKRVGHTGTLDPEVEGVLPICLGQATRVVEYVQELPKRYRGSLMLGMATDTEDQTGQVIERVEAVPEITREEVESIIQRFVGEIEQVPPMYSAVKMQGKRLYELAREGKVVERPSRKVTIYELTLLDLEPGRYPVLHFDVLCSKGTYVRTLCVDLGKALGYPAHMTSLVRMQSGPFHLEDCYTVAELETLAAKEEWQGALTAIDGGLGHFPAVIVSEDEGKKVLDGVELALDESGIEAGQLFRVYVESGGFLALYRMDSAGRAKPEKVFRDVER